MSTGSDNARRFGAINSFGKEWQQSSDETKAAAGLRSATAR